MASFTYLINSSGAEIALNPERVVLLEAGDESNTTKVWCQRSDDEAAPGNCIIVRGGLRSVAEDLTD